MTELDNIDYKNILNYYNMSIPKTIKQTKIKAEKILASKFCSCIKKFYKKNEIRSIGLCTKSVINQKGYIRGKFTCKKKRQIHLSKKRKNTTKKHNKK